MDKRIEIGDIVRVNFNNAMTTLCHRARVIYIPTDHGDSWIFDDLDKDGFHYVSEPCTVTLLKKGDEPF